MARRRSLMQLISGQVAALIVLAILPAVIIAALFEQIGWPAAAILCLFLAQSLSLTAEYAISSHWSPGRWGLAFTIPLPVMNTVALIWLMRTGEYSLAVGALSLAYVATHLIVLGVKRQIRGDGDDHRLVERQTGTIGSSNHTAETDLSMMEF